MHLMVNQMRKILLSPKNLHLIMIKLQPWTLCHIQMVLRPLITLVGRHFIMKSRVFWLEKKILIPYWMKVVLVLLLKWEDFHRTKSQKHPWHQNIFGHSYSLHQHRLQQLVKLSVSTTFPLLVSWTQSHQYYCYSFFDLFISIFLPLLMLGSNINRKGGGVEHRRNRL